MKYLTILFFCLLTQVVCKNPHYRVEYPPYDKAYQERMIDSTNAEFKKERQLDSMRKKQAILAGQGKKVVHFSFKNASLRTALSKLRKEYGLNYGGHSDFFNSAHPITATAKRISLAIAVKVICKGQAFKCNFTYTNKFLYVGDRK